MKFEEKLKKQQHVKLWQEYCGFLDLSIEEYMQIQYRLMDEQIEMWSESGLGKRLLLGRKISSVDEFRRTMPLTTYKDYADILLTKRTEMLPCDPVIWISTTWEGGNHPVKLAPYSRSMIDVYKNNVIASLMLCTSTARGQFLVEPKDKTLYGFAPLPYATGLFPLLLNEEITLNYLPSLEDGEKMSFGERNRAGFKQGINRGIDLFFGMSSIVSYITESFISGGSSRSSGRGSVLNMNIGMVSRYLGAANRAKRDGVPLRPKELFKLKGFVCAGTDTACYKDYLEENWGIRPMEIAAGTELTLIGTETWLKDGIVLFPDACFYEFIPECEMLKSEGDESYQPSTCLLNELETGKTYELVISTLKGGAFMRYRVGDVYQCLSTGDIIKGGVRLPRLTYLDRVPSVIDIAGFTRITENSIKDVIGMSGLKIKDWFAQKEFDERRRPYLHLYVEPSREAYETSAVSREVLAQHLSVYFNYFDSDYHDLKRLLGIDPLKITILRTGTMELYRIKQPALRRINPGRAAISEILSSQERITDSRFSAMKGGDFIDG